MAFGSIPIVEDVMTPGFCSRENKSPLRLLKKHRAPIIYVKSWKELLELMDREQDKPVEDIYQRRKNMLIWYDSFKDKMKDLFINVVKMKFFNEKIT